MTFDPNSDVNWAAYVAKKATLNGHDAADLDQRLIQYLASSATSGITLNSAAFTAALTSANTSVKSKKATF